MAYAPSRYDSPFSGTVMTPWVKRLLIANTAVFLPALLLRSTVVGQAIAEYLALRPDQVLFRPWTIVTYAFLHLGFGHFFFNMLALFFFGPSLEERFGGRGFLKLYAVSAAGGAVVTLLGGLVFPWGWAVVLGASAAINGLLLAYAMAWPDREILFFGVFPIKAKYFVGGMAVFSLLAASAGLSDGTAHLAHLGGFLFAFLLMRSPWAPNPWGELPTARRARKKNPVAAWIGEARRRPAPEQPAARAPRPVASAGRGARAERELLDDVDRILDKIRAEGLQSLTPEERARLDEVSRRLRTN